MAQHFSIAANWDSAHDEDKVVLKKFINDLVKYPCKIACKLNDDWVDIYVFSEKKQKVTDWIEMQPTGAIGVIYDFYKEGVNTDALEKACDTYNLTKGLKFEEDEEDEEDEEEGEEVEEENEQP